MAVFCRPDAQLGVAPVSAELLPCPVGDQTGRRASRGPAGPVLGGLPACRVGQFECSILVIHKICGSGDGRHGRRPSDTVPVRCGAGRGSRDGGGECHAEGQTQPAEEHAGLRVAAPATVRGCVHTVCPGCCREGGNAKRAVICSGIQWTRFTRTPRSNPPRFRARNANCESPPL